MWKRGRARQHCEVLLAEDNAHDKLLFALAVEDSHTASKVTFADDGQLLLETLREMHGTDEQPDVIVLDLQMPRMGGYDTLAEIRSDPALADLPVVVFSNSSQPNEMQRSLDTGAAMHVAKPSTYEELLIFVDSLIDISSEPAARTQTRARAT